MEAKNDLTYEEELPSTFTGGALANYFIGFITMIVSLLTLGLAYPAMVCWKLRWKASHTYLNGEQLTFDGKAMQLMGKYMLWMFLSLITFGLYFIFSVKLKLTEWETKHTHFAYYNYDENDNQSKFNGKWYQLLGVNFVFRFVTVITLFLGYYWAHCYKERWYCRHKTIDGCELHFDGTGMQYFGKCIKWGLLTLVTLGIYSFWLPIKSIKWTVSHTILLDMPDEENFMSNEEFNAAYVSEKEKPMTISSWLGTFILLAFPLIGGICGICWFFGMGNRHRTVWVRSYVVLTLIIVFILGILLGVGYVVLSKGAVAEGYGGMAGTLYYSACKVIDLLETPLGGFESAQAIKEFLAEKLMQG